MKYQHPTWKPFEKNEYLPLAGLTILEVLFVARLQLDTRYRIQYQCCKVVREMSHKQIAGRIGKARQKLKATGLKIAPKGVPISLCSPCGRRRKGDPVAKRLIVPESNQAKLAVVPPTAPPPPAWAVPPSLRGMRFIWGGYQI